MFYKDASKTVGEISPADAQNKSENQKIKNRENKYDCMKGFAIIGMVLCHAGASRPIIGFVYLFHMSFFFILAGFFFKYDAVNDIKSVVLFILKRIQRLWLPFALWGGAFVLLHNIFIDWHIYSVTPAQGDVLAKQAVSRLWTYDETLSTYLNTLLLQDGMLGMAGAFWFMRVLFFASILYCFAKYCVHQLTKSFIVQKKFVLMIISVFVIMALLASRYYMPRIIGQHIPRIGGTVTITAIALIHIGVLLRYFNFNFLDKVKGAAWATGIVSSAILYLLSHVGSIELGADVYPSIIFLLVCSTIGWFMLESFAVILERWQVVLRILSYIGAHTMPILIFHFLSFKIVSFAGVTYLNLPVDDISAFPFTFRGFGWCLAYTAVGIAIPLALSWGYHKIIPQTFRKNLFPW